MQEDDPNFQTKMQTRFRKAAFIRALGISLIDVGPGWCESELMIEEWHLQQNTFIHGGVLATMADHTAGGAAGSLVGTGQIVLTAEFKINLLRPAQGSRLHCRAEVLKAGSRLTVAESSVYDDEEKLVAKATVTLAVVEVDG